MNDGNFNRFEKLGEQMSDNPRARFRMMLDGDAVYVRVDKYDHDCWSVELPGDALDITSKLTSRERAKVERAIERHFNKVR